jgi:CRISPR system CASCADE complex protein casA
MKEIEFDLLTEPWIRVRLKDNTVQEVSLTEALVSAQDYVDLAGEMPTQDAAVLRLLLAVLFTVFSRVNVKGEPEPLEKRGQALRRWSELWQLGHFPAEPIRDYLEQWKDRFWLFHPTHPFWQVPTLCNGIAFGGKKLNGERAESGNKTPLFQNVSKTECEVLSYAQAARWLIYQNGYDERGGRPKAGNKPRHGVGWLGQIGFVAVKGKNLYETLLRNMAFPTEQDALREEQQPCWEREQVRAEQSVKIVMPKNQAELLTLQSRRILLKRSETVPGVVGYEVLGGDYWDSENAFGEQMTLWSRTSKKNEKMTYKPQQHEAGKQLWREIPSMLDPEGRKPGVLTWNQQLQSLRILSRKEQIVLNMVGIRYDNQEASVKDVYTDQLAMQLAVLDELSRPWTVRINQEVERCEKAAESIGVLCKELKLAGGLDYNQVKGFKETQKVTEDARAQFYFAVDQPFRQWLQEIDPEQDDPDEAVLRWQAQARSIAEELGAKMVREAGNAALKGHRIAVGDKKTERTILYTSPKAYNRFRASLREIYPKTEP